MTFDGPGGGESFPPGIGARPALLHAIRHTPDEVEQKTSAIHKEILARADAIDALNFSTIGTADLRILFDLYDRELYGGLLGRFLSEDQSLPLGFRLSSRMTNAAGKATRRAWRDPRTPNVERRSYEIAVSTTILFGSFNEPGRPMKVGGRLCHDRVAALQVILEHETLHLAEFLAWGWSSCSGPNFKTLSRRIFGHEASNHELMTPRLEAAQTHGIHPGDRVAFDFEGKTYRGIVNRITRRATVLVPDPNGRRFTDGKTYATFYVPVSDLRKEPPPRP